MNELRVSSCSKRLSFETLHIRSCYSYYKYHPLLLFSREAFNVSMRRYRDACVPSMCKSTYVFFFSFRCLRTPPGGFEDELPGSFGRYASDKGRGGPLSTANMRVKRMQNRSRKPLLNPNLREQDDAKQCIMATTCKATHAQLKHDLHEHPFEPRDSSDKRLPQKKQQWHVDASAAVSEEKELSAEFSIRPINTVFGLELDRLEEDYLRESGQIHQRAQRAVQEAFSSYSRGKFALNAQFAKYGAGEEGKRMRWAPSSSFDAMREGEEALARSNESYEEKNLSMPVNLGTAEEQRRRAKRDPRLTVGSTFNQHLDGFFMSAEEEMKKSKVKPLNGGAEKGTSGVEYAFVSCKDVSFEQQKSAFPLNRYTVKLSKENAACKESDREWNPSEKKSAKEDQPANKNPHFPVSSEEVTHQTDEETDTLAQLEFRQLEEAVQSELSALSPPAFPTVIKIDGHNGEMFLEGRRETRTFLSTQASSHPAPSPVYNAYNPRPYEASVPLLREANYWDEHPVEREKLDNYLEKEVELFQREWMMEGVGDTSEVEYSTQKVRKETLLYFQAHPMNEMITEPFVRIREIHPRIFPSHADSSTEQRSRVTEGFRGEVLRYHPETSEYPSGWLQLHSIPNGLVESHASDNFKGENAVGKTEQTNENKNRAHSESLSDVARANFDRVDVFSTPPSHQFSPRDAVEGAPEKKDLQIASYSSSEAGAENEVSRDSSIVPSSKGAETSLEESSESTREYNCSLEKAVEYLFYDRDVPLLEARRIAEDLGLDLLQIGSMYTANSDRRIIALCAIGDHREHLRQMLRFKMQKLGVQPPPTMNCVEVPFKGGTHPHAMRVKAVGIAKRLLHRHVVRVQLTKFGTPREGFPVLQTILDEIRQQCDAVHAYHTAGRIQSNYNEIFCYLYPSTGKSPKNRILHPSPSSIRAAQEVRELADEKEILFDDYHNLVTRKEQLRYAAKIADGTAWAEKDAGMSLQRQRAIKVMLGYLPKGNKEMYAARGDVNIPAPFRTSHPTGTDRWSQSESRDNLEQASRGAAVLGKRAAMDISAMHDNQETEDQPSILDHFYYRVQGSALEVGELKEALGLKDNRKKGIPLAPGFATLSNDTHNRSGNAEPPFFAAK